MTAATRTVPPAARRPQPGEYRVGRYRVRARLGKGGMGVVYLGRDEALDRDVAIKTLRVEGSQDDESRGRFEIEAKAAARLQHPNIVTVFELGEDRGLPYIAMELLGGQDLETLVRSGDPLSTQERLDIVIQTLRGLDFAHNHQIVHRDIKPSNIRVLDDGGVKILDFGIAKVESTSVTRAGMMVGTPFYMSPEHIRGGVLDGRSDVFAVGVILHELFAGRRPFSATDSQRILYHIVHEAHPRLPEKAAGALTAEVQRVIDRALEKDADARYASAAQMADDLTRVRDTYPHTPLSDADADALNQARKSLASNRSDDSTRNAITRIAKANPDSSDAQRLLRLSKRKPAESAAASETSSFPELDATFAKAEMGGAETISQGRTISGTAETIAQGSKTQATVAVPGSQDTGGGASPKLVYAAIAALVVTGVVGGSLFFKQRMGGANGEAQPTPTITEIIVSSEAPGAPPASTRRPSAPPSAPVVPVANGAAPNVPPTAPASLPAIIEIRSQPAGAAVRIDRKPVGVTPLVTAMVSSVEHVVSLSLQGYQTKEISVALPLPKTVEATLTPDGPPGNLVLESAYPVTVSLSGRTIVTEKSTATVSLPAGSYDLVIESPSVFLKLRESVRLEAGGSFAIKTPSAGKISVRATPDNCKVFVDGAFVDYPPILDHGIVSGNHVISFEWPDGSKSEERVDIQAGKPSYVMGRKR